MCWEMPCKPVGVSAHDQLAGRGPKKLDCTVRLLCKTSEAMVRMFYFKNCNTAVKEFTDS